MAVNKERIALWVKALESGEYRQGRGFLRALASEAVGWEPESFKYCCLGVATEVAVANGLQITDADWYNLGVPRPQEQILDLIGFLQRAAFPETLWEPVSRWYGFWYGFDAWETNPVVDTFMGIPVTATEANDSLRLAFAQIAVGLRRTYLGEGSWE